MSSRTAAVVTVSDRVSAGTAEDRSGPAVIAVLESVDFEVVEYRVIPDGADSVAGALTEIAGTVDLVLTTGGTGLTPRDLTPEGTRAVLEREAPGLAEAMRAATFGENPHGMLSRGVAGTVGSTLVGSRCSGVSCGDPPGPLARNRVASTRFFRPQYVGGRAANML